MVSGFEKLTEAAEGTLEKGPKSTETSREIPAVDNLRSRMKEAFSPPVEGKNFELPQKPESQGKPKPESVTLGDGTVVRLPDGPRTKPGLEANEIAVNKTDDHGEIYCTNGKLGPNCTYELNGNTYKTNENGRLIVVIATPKLSPENERNNAAQREVGGKDRQEGDQGGHIVGRDLGGDGGEGNLVAMNPRINQSDYKRMENDVKRDLNEGKNVTTYTEIAYSGNSERPSIIKVTKTVDGKDTVYIFDNNIDGALRKRIGEVYGKDAADNVKSVLKETNGEVSSIKEEHEENRSLSKVTVNITYTDTDGNTRRRTVVIDKPKGGSSND